LEIIPFGWLYQQCSLSCVAWPSKGARYNKCSKGRLKPVHHTSMNYSVLLFCGRYIQGLLGRVDWWAMVHPPLKYLTEQFIPVG